MKKYHICLVSEEYPEETNYGGISTYNKALADLLINDGHKVTVITSSTKNYNEYYEDGIRVIRITPFFRKIVFLEKLIGYRLAVCLKLKSIIKDEKIDIIETPEWKAELFLLFLFNLHKKLNIVVRLHGCRSIIRKYNNENINIADKFVIMFEKLILKKAKNISSISEAVLVETENILNINLREKSEIIYNFIESKDKVINQFKKTEDCINILFVGRLDYLKGIFTIADVIQKLLDKYNNLNFIFIGKDYYDKTNLKFNSEIILSKVNDSDKEKVKFLGHIEKSKLDEYYKKAYVTVLPSHFESFGFTCIESMYNGTPVIGGNHGGMSEIISDKINGILIDPNDREDLYLSICKLIDNIDLRNLMGAKAVETIDEKFTDKIIIKKINNYYKQILR